MLSIKGNIIIKTFSTLLSIVMIACSSHDESPVIYGGNIMLSVAEDNLIEAIESRASIESLMPQSIGVYAEINGMDEIVFDNQPMYYKQGIEIVSAGLDTKEWPTGNDWVYDPPKSWIVDKEYTFYGYSPYSNENATMKNTGPNTRSFHLSDIPPLSATEYLVGKEEVIVSSGASATTPVKLQMTHITSRLRFMFAIGEAYNQLREIDVKSIKISDSGDKTPYWECTVNIGASIETQIEVNKSTKIYNSAGDIELIPEGSASHRLTPKYSSFSSAYNLLGQIPNTTLTVTYDVFDKKGQPLRENQTATNVIDLSKWTFEKGKCYDVRIMVSPKYLYVLSDNDMPEVLMEPKETSESPSEPSDSSTTP